MTHPPATRIGPATFAWGTRTFVMGILNVTPDSFSGDGLLGTGDATQDALAQARQMVREGADVLDIGGESTRPGHEPVTAEDEAARVIPVIRAVRAALPDTPISIDTTKAVVADAAIAAGADMVNDVWGTAPAADEVAAVAARRHVPLVVMHNRSEAVYGDVVQEVIEDLRAAVERAERLGVGPEDLIVDPGIGFGKTADHNVTVLRHLASVRLLGRPILLGTSRKSTLGRILDLPPGERLEATLATTALGVGAGIDMVRVHDVQANVRAARVADAIVRGTWRAEPDEGGSR